MRRWNMFAEPGLRAPGAAAVVCCPGPKPVCVRRTGLVSPWECPEVRRGTVYDASYVRIGYRGGDVPAGR